MGPVVLWITSALGPLSKAYFASLKLGGQRQHVKIWKCLVFCPTFRQFSSPQPFPFHNHQCGHCRCLLFVSSHCNSLLVSDTWIKPCDTHLFFYEGLLAIVSCCEPSFHFLFPERWCYGVNVTEEELKNMTLHRLWYSLQEKSVKWTFSALSLITYHSSSSS